MSAPRTSSPQRRSFNEQFSSQNDNLHIRMVPYSPHRISSDDLPPSQQASPGSVEIYGQDGSPSSVNLPTATLDIKGKGRESHAESNRFVTPEGIKSQPLSRRLSLSPSPSATPSPSWRRPKRVVNLHPDGTFSLVQQPESLSSRADSISSPLFSYATPSSSYGRVSSGTILDDFASSPLAPVAEQKYETILPVSPAQSTVQLHPSSGSPWNYPPAGGSRKNRSEASGYSLELSGPSESHLPQPSADVNPSAGRAQGAPLSTKHSFHSSISGSTLSERTNYKVYDHSSLISGSVNDFSGLDLGSLPPSSSGSHYAMLRDNASVAQSDDQSFLPSDQSEANYVIHGGRSRSSSFLAGPRSHVRTEYSQESLVVAPLRPIKQTSAERSIHAKSRSCDSSRTTSSKTGSSRTGSLRSLRSLSSFVHREAPHLMDGNFNALPAEGDDEWRVSSNIAPNAPRRSLSRKKHWSTTLSTVFSEGETGSEPPSRSLSPLFNAPSRGSGLHSNHGRRFGSFSSSLAGLDETLAKAASHSRTVSLDRPPAVYNRDLTQGNQRLIRDHDEDGDGLAELEDMHRRTSRVRRHSLLSSRSSDQNLRSSRSSGSSRASSMNRGSLPHWARLYYGSGERRFLAYKPSYESMASSEFSDSQPRNSLLSRSPSVECYATDINNPRRRPRDYAPPDSDTISEAPMPHPLLLVARSIKKRTSSIWSPHLRQDRRASRYSIWAPPSLVGCHDTSFFWRRNIQIVLFVIGFILPFAWMIGAVLPLPTKPFLEMAERDHSTSHLDLRMESRHQMQDFNELRLRNRTKWWRGVNRRMSILGILLIGAYIALAVVGVHQQWAISRKLN
ncbi:hypothetical protein PT974_02751 [Cladobotryum mycophilum]|uniref:Serine-rich protein n=1 Tax=Cladobotryum mycophilum TaxID=491253 RepID=A0ABR0T065_9HYPO